MTSDTGSTDPGVQTADTDTADPGTPASDQLKRVLRRVFESQIPNYGD